VPEKKYGSAVWTRYRFTARQVQIDMGVIVRWRRSDPLELGEAGVAELRENGERRHWRGPGQTLYSALSCAICGGPSELAP
jgi:hypothetical protein